MTATRPRLAGLSALISTTALFGLTLTGCAKTSPDPQRSKVSQQAESTQAPPQLNTDAPTSSAEEAGTPVPVGCNAILPLEIVHDSSEQLQLHMEGVPAEEKLASLLGPVTMATIRAGVEPQYCGWGIDRSDAIAYMGVALIDEASKAELLAALRDSVYVEVDADGAEAAFQQSQSPEHRYVDAIVIDGDLLIAVTHTISGDFARDAWKTVQATRG